MNSFDGFDGVDGRDGFDGVDGRDAFDGSDASGSHRSRRSDGSRGSDGLGSDGSRGSPGACPGVPSECRHASQLLLAACEGLPDPARIAALRRELAGCRPCLETFDFQMNVQGLLALHCREQAPESLRIRISETLQRIDLSGIEVTDL